MPKHVLKVRPGDGFNPADYIRGIIEERYQILLERVASRLRDLVEDNFASGVVDDLTEKSSNPGPRQASVFVTVRRDGDRYAVVADGEDAVWVEFGAGVHHNSEVGSSPNPNGPALSFTIGTYGLGMGANDKWAIPGGDWTYGTPAQMPMYNAVQQLKSEVPQIAKEVFGQRL